jgi:hypothetical protein
MKKIYQILFWVFLFFGSSFSSFAQKSFFSVVSEASLKGKVTGKRVIIPQKFSTTKLDVDALKAFLWSLPSEKQLTSRLNAPVMMIPMPDGSMARFNVWESTVQEPGLEAKFPEIRTFAGQGIDDRYANIRLDFNPYWGFSAQILSINGRVLVDAYSRGDINYYMSYNMHDAKSPHAFNCLTNDNLLATLKPGQGGSSNFTEATGPCRGTQLMTYRLVVACTGEYAQAVGGGTAAGTHAAIVTAVNRINQVYESELSVHVNLVANNNLVEYLNPSSDPYLNDADTDLDTNTPNVNSVIGAANYDYGHLFCTTDGGVAYRPSVCSTTGATSGVGGKAGGLTGLPNPVGDPFYIDYVAHEMGHQFGGNHTFNSTTGSCGGGNRSAVAAYEVGSATTIMGYAGICGANNIQPNSDPYFHTNSFDEASNHISGAGGCGVSSATGNTLPVITAMNNNGVSIPVGTPFTLTGAATDADGDAVSYDWEEWDLGTAGNWDAGATSTTAPLFKSRIPKASGSRTFPDIAVILAGYPATPAATMGGLKGETLPQVARALKFRLTVRDNRAGGGGVVTGGNGCQTGFTAPFQINVVGSQPFLVTVPNGGESYAAGSSQNITWNVAGTNAAPVSAANVKISLSTDGGLTYPTVLTASTPNDGTESLVIPGPATTTAKIKVEAVGNIFFDISNANFTITAPVNDFVFGTSVATPAACPATTATATVPTTVTGTFVTPIALTATAGVPSGTTVTFAPNPLTPGSSATATLNIPGTLAPGTYAVTVTGTAGTTVHTTTVNFVISAGAAPTITTIPTAQTVCAPAPATFTVASSTAGVTYQWQSGPSATGTFTNVSTGTGGTTVSYTTPATTAAMNGTFYRVIVSSTCGTITTTPVSLTVNTAAAIGTQPANASACTGNTAVFSVAATGTGATYQWQSGASATGPWTNVTTGTGGTTATYTTAAVTGTTPAFYHVIVTTTTCPNVATSNAAQLIISTTTSITLQPTNAVACTPNTSVFTVAAAGTGNTYQWQSGPSATGPFTNVTGGTGATTASYTTPATTAAMNGTFYQVVITGSCNTITSTPASLTVNTAAVITTQPTAQVVCNGTPATFTSAATGTGATYQWYVSTAAVPAYTAISGATAATLTLATTTPAMNGNSYHVIVTTTACAGSVTSNNVTLTVNTVATIGTQPTAQSACVPNTATFTVAATGTGLSYQWQVAQAAAPTVFADIPGATSASYTTPATTFAMNGNVYRVNILSTCSPTTPTTSNTAVLTVNNPVSVTQNPIARSGCAGDNFTFSVTATSGGTISYQWQVSTNGGTTYTNITGATSATYTVAAPPVNFSGYLYRVIVSGVPCGLVTTPGAALTLSNRPQVVLTAANGSVNPISTNPGNPSGLYATVSPDPATVNYVFSWTRDGIVLPILSSSITPANGFLDAFGAYQVTVTDVSTGCTSKSNIVTVSDIPSQRDRLFVYPNPTRGIVHLSYYSSTVAAQSRMVMVYDGKGARVMQKAFAPVGTYGQMSLDLSGLNAGVYMVQLLDASGRKLGSEQIIKNN